METVARNGLNLNAKYKKDETYKTNTQTIKLIV